MFVKSIYSDIIKGRHNVYGQPILIYGAGSLGILTKNSLLNEESKYKIIGFIDDNESLVGKTVHGIEVFGLEQALMRFISSTSKQPQVIVAIKNIDLNRRKQLAERFLQHNIIIKIIPPRFELFENRIDHKIITNIKIEELLQRDTIILDDVNVKQEIDHKIVLVTGAAGSIGSELVRQIVQYNPSKVYLIDHSESAVYNLEYELKQKINPLTELHFIISDVNNYLRLERLVEGIKPDVVYHCAAYKHVPLMESLPYEAIRTNIFGTKNIADLCKKFEVKKFIMISTDKAVNPTNVMGVTKRIAELYVQSLNRSPNCKTKYVITRFGNVLGSNGSVIPLFEKQILNGGPITVTHPDIERFFMTIPEACQLVLEASAMGEGGEIFIFDMGKPVKIVELARKMIQLSGLVPDQDILIKFTALRPGEKLFEELLGDNEENIKTHHPKIMIGKATSAHVKNIDLFLIELSKALVGQQELALIKLLKQFIPEYKSKNSKFENLDSDANSMSYSETV